MMFNNTLILYAYNEITDPLQRREIETELRVNSSFYEECIQLSELRDKLDLLSCGPSERATNRILAYARALDVIHTQSAGTVCLCSN